MREFDTSESMKNAGILDVFPIFVLHDWGKRSTEARSPHCAKVGRPASYVQERTWATNAKKPRRTGKSSRQTKAERLAQRKNQEPPALAAGLSG